MNRIEQAREALAADRKADAAVDKILKDLSDLDEQSMDRVLERLVALLQTTGKPAGKPNGKVTRRVEQPKPKAETFAELPHSVQGGAELWKKLSGLPEHAICERVANWLSVHPEETVAQAFELMKEERPSHEMSFLESQLGA